VYDTRKARTMTAVTRWTAGSRRRTSTTTSARGRKKNEEYARLRMSTASAGSGIE